MDLLAHPTPVIGAHPSPPMLRDATNTAIVTAEFEPRTAPLRQMAPALMAMHTSLDGTRHMDLRLHPASLGEVRVQISRADETPIRVAISATRAETLALLREDTHALHQALNAAGIPASNRELIFLLTPPTPAASDPGAPTMQAPADGSGRRDEASPHSRPAAQVAMAADEDHLPSLAPPRWVRAGLDITA